jgi:hypothetical protein
MHLTYFGAGHEAATGGSCKEPPHKILKALSGVFKADSFTDLMRKSWCRVGFRTGF